MFDEHKDPIPWISEGDEHKTKVWLARFHQEFLTRVGKNHVDIPPGPWFYMQRRLEENKRVTCVKTRDVLLPIGWPGGDDVGIECREEVGQLMVENAINLTGAWRPKLIEEGVPESEVDLWTRETVADVTQLRVKAYMPIYIFTARVK
jgi:hypothetical protein